MWGYALLIADAEPEATRLKKTRLRNDWGHGSTFLITNEALRGKQGLLILLIRSVVFAEGVVSDQTNSGLAKRTL